MIVINDNLGTYGGSIMLVERLCLWAKANNIPVCVFTYDCSNKEVVDAIKNSDIDIYCFDVDNYQLLKEHIKEVELIDSDLTFLSFTINNFMNVEKVKKKEKKTFRNVIYSIHPATLFKGTGVNNKVFKKLICIRYKRLINRLNNKDAVIFMDEDNVESAEMYYGMKFTKKTSIIPLPMVFDSFSNQEMLEKIKKSYESKTIITSCRADFPFKGYLFGLLDDFVVLSNEHKNIKLELVSSGEKEDVDKLQSKIDSLPLGVQKNIKFYKWIEYDRLKKMIRDSYLYIGMGTGILDAATQYVPAIPVKYNTYENISRHDFSQDPTMVVEEQNCGVKAIGKINELINLAYEEYETLSIKTYNEAKRIYDIKRFFDSLLSIENKKSFLNGIDVLVHTLNTKRNMNKQKNLFSCSDIIYEEDNNK